MGFGHIDGAGQQKAIGRGRLRVNSLRFHADCKRPRYIVISAHFRRQLRSPLGTRDEHIAAEHPIDFPNVAKETRAPDERPKDVTPLSG